MTRTLTEIRHDIEHLALERADVLRELGNWPAPSGMVRDTSEGKTNYLLIRFGPMLRRWAAHLTKGEAKYPPPEIGVPNWTLAAGQEELQRFRESACRHFEQWLAGETDEDHAAAVLFNINGAEFVRERLEASGDGASSRL
jgi:hypothetical protein